MMKKLFAILLVFSLYVSGCQTEQPDPETPDTDDTETPADSNQTDEEETDGEDTADETEETNDEENVDTTEYDNIKVSVEDAFDVFMDKYPDAKVNEIELELEGNTYEYEIEGYEGTTEYEITIDAFTKETSDEHESHESDESGELNRDDLNKVNDYVEEALSDAGADYWVDEWELKVKSDYTKFEIELKNDNDDEIEYKYDFDSGELLDKDID